LLSIIAPAINAGRLVTKKIGSMKLRGKIVLIVDGG
jgi:hypothetical protein